MIDISMKHCADYVAKGKVKVMHVFYSKLRSLLSGQYFENIECFSLVDISHGLRCDVSFLAKVLTPSMHEEPAICYGLFYFDCTGTVSVWKPTDRCSTGLGVGLLGTSCDCDHGRKSSRFCRVVESKAPQLGHSSISCSL